MRFIRTLAGLAVPLLVLALGAGPAMAGGAITSGQSVTGNISGPTFSDGWTFTGTTGQRVIITAVTASGAVNTNIRLHPPTGADELNAPPTGPRSSLGTPAPTRSSGKTWG